MQNAVQICFRADAVADGTRLGTFLRRQGVSLSLIRSLKFREGGILLNGGRARTSDLLAAGDQVVLTMFEPARLSAEPEDLPLQILYESAHAMVLGKPPGQMMHPVGARRRGTLANAFCGLMARRGTQLPFRPVGRLDADTSGLVLCALTPYAAPLLGKSMHKAYLALATGRMPPGGGCIDLPLAPQPGSAIRQQAGQGGRPARTRYSVLAAADQASLLLVRPQTGRTHQIRAHFAGVGFPLLGDVLYGGGTALVPRQALHCAALRFEEPLQGGQALELPPPEDMRRAAAALGLPLPEEGFAWWE